MKQIDHSLIMISLLTSTVGKTHVEFHLRTFSVPFLDLSPWNIATLQRLSLAGTDAPCISTELVNQGGLDPGSAVDLISTPEQLGFLRFSHKLIEHFGYVQVPNSAPVGPVGVAKTCKNYHNDPVDFHWNSFKKQLGLSISMRPSMMFWRACCKTRNCWPQPARNLIGPVGLTSFSQIRLVSMKVMPKYSHYCWAGWLHCKVNTACWQVPCKPFDLWCNSQLKKFNSKKWCPVTTGVWMGATHPLMRHEDGEKGAAMFHQQICSSEFLMTVHLGHPGKTLDARHPCDLFQGQWN